MPLARRRMLAIRMTWAVVALQGALLLTLALTPSDPPDGPHLLQLIWASMHRPTFYPLIALLCAGPPLTFLAWRSRGEHRAVLILSWIVFLAVMSTAFGERSLVMLRILWWHVNQ